MKYFSLPLLTLALQLCSTLSNAQSCPKWGPYINAKLKQEADVNALMTSVMIPAEGNTPATYTCAIQFGIGKSGGYCGLQNKNSSATIETPLNCIFSIWDFPNKQQLIASYIEPHTFVGGFGNEGTGLHSHNDFGWVPGQWYTHVVRRWYTGGGKTQVGYFIYDQTKKEWHHFVTFDVPEADAKLHSSIGSFLENFADDQKRSRISNYSSYWQLTGKNEWIPADALTASGGPGYWDAKAFGTNGVQLTSCGPDSINKEKVSFAVKENGTVPEIVKPAFIHDAATYYDKNEKTLYVNWQLEASGAPQLSYEIAVYDNKDKKGNPIASLKGTDPDVRSVRIADQVLAEKTYYVHIKITDIFNQQSKESAISLRPLKP